MTGVEYGHISSKFGLMTEIRRSGGETKVSMFAIGNKGLSKMGNGKRDVLMTEAPANAARSSGTWRRTLCIMTEVG